MQSASRRPDSPLRPLKTLFTLFHLIAFAIVYHVAPEPYIDEIFHVPQAQAYCRGDFSYWDNKITTPPGLYSPDMFGRGLMGGTLYRGRCIKWPVWFLFHLIYVRLWHCGFWIVLLWFLLLRDLHGVCIVIYILKRRKLHCYLQSYYLHFPFCRSLGIYIIRIRCPRQSFYGHISSL